LLVHSAFIVHKFLSRYSPGFFRYEEGNHGKRWEEIEQEESERGKEQNISLPSEKEE